MREALQYFAISLVSVIISLYAFEGYLTLEQRKSTLAASKILAAEDARRVPSRHPGEFMTGPGIQTDAGIIYPLGDVSNQDTTYCNENGYWTKYTTDAYGLRNRTHEGTFDTLLIGDSYTQGACVRNEDTMHERLSAGGRPTYTAGQGDHGPMMELASLKEYFPLIKPKNVVWLYFEANDLYFLQDEMNNPFYGPYLSPDKQPINITKYQQEIDDFISANTKQKIAKTKEEGVWEFDFDDFAKLNLTINRIRPKDKKASPCFNESSYPDNFDPFLQIIKEARRYTEAEGANFYFLYLPEYNRFTDESCDFGYDRVMADIKDQGIPYIDLKELIEQSDDPKSYFPFRKRGHYTPETYAWIAELLEDMIAAAPEGELAAHK